MTSAKKSIVFYPLLLSLFLLSVNLVLKIGDSLQPPQAVLSTLVSETPASSSQPTHSPFLFLIQFFIVCLFAKVLGFLFQKWHQPAVMGEIAAGILLGPSLFGWWMPDLFHQLFPPTSLEPLKVISKIGILIFMFMTGMELDAELLKKKGSETLLISHAGILFPFFLGTLASLALYPVFGISGTSFRAFALFMGIAMSITAFPVLARILEERKLMKTPLGVTAMGCAAVDDVTAWCLLAGVIQIIKAESPNAFFMTLGWTLVYTLAMLGVIRPFLFRIIPKMSSWTKTVFLLSVMFLSAWATEKIGIHALFGAFFAGVIAPEVEETSWLHRRLAWISGILLPLFFALTGLRTQIGLINSLQVLGLCFLIIFVAMAGKIGGSVMAAKFLHSDWPHAFFIGILMNTRGLMELIVLHIGYDLGILSPQIFAMMVLMALVTTFATQPLLTLTSRISKASLPQ